MNNYTAKIVIMPLDELLDPQGKVVTRSLHNLGLNLIEDVRIGKHINLNVQAVDEASAHAMVDDACKKLLANVIMEKYSFTLIPSIY
ncbi:MAG: phosphoribosylformylglycinamidine synthase subunit PurS [Bacteroidota bacterium]|nr:phosphoribosylformylglycinamidine synthase subunit PurS [Bacteroidota bacterium]